MKRMVSIISLALLLAVGVLPAFSQDDSRGCFDRVDRSAREGVLERVNRERQKNNLPLLACDAALSAIAQAHAVDMARRGYFNHTTPEGRDVFDRLSEAGISYTRAGENIAWNLEGPRSVVRLWMGSPGHRANILGDFTKAGVGSYNGYYVLVLVKE